MILFIAPRVSHFSAFILFSVLPSVSTERVKYVHHLMKQGEGAHSLNPATKMQLVYAVVDMGKTGNKRKNTDPNLTATDEVEGKQSTIFVLVSVCLITVTRYLFQTHVIQLILSVAAQVFFVIASESVNITYYS